jgi:hypothetical protein
MVARGPSDGRRMLRAIRRVCIDSERRHGRGDAVSPAPNYSRRKPASEGVAGHFPLELGAGEFVAPAWGKPFPQSLDALANPFTATPILE